MKKPLQFLGFIASVLFAGNAFSQLPDNGVYPGGLMLESYTPSTSYTGNIVYAPGIWDVDSILDSGTPVILDLYATWCGPCWSYHTGGTLETLYDDKGWGGTGEVAIFGVESHTVTPAALMEAEANGSTYATNSQGDWLNDTKYPMINNDNAASMFNLSYFPTIIMICPDRTVTEVGQTTVSGFTAAMNNCSAAATNTNDLRMYQSTTASSDFVCQATSKTSDVSFLVQNYSTTTMTGSYDIELSDGSSVVASTTVNLNLDSYEVEEVTFTGVTLNSGTNNFTASITTTNDDLTNDDLAISVTLEDAQDIEVGPNKTVRIELTMDDYASEVGFALREGNPTTTDAVSLYNSSTANNSIAYLADGTLTDGTNSFSQDYVINDYGCHYFVTYDDYGDGINYNTSSANATISSNDSYVIDGGWDDGTIVVFNFVSGPAGIESETLENLKISVYPNPATDNTNIKLNLTDNSSVAVNVVNTLGQTVYSSDYGVLNGEQTLQLSTSNLENGVYFVNITVNGTTTTERLTVNK